jgi:hypothetical protein
MTQENRKTSLGMQAVGRGLPMHDLPLEASGELARGNARGAHVTGVLVTLLLHVGIFGSVVTMNECDRSHVAAHPAEEPYQAIEAGLAIKRKAQEGKKSALPQKDVAAKVKPPDAPGITKNADAVPKEDPKKKKPDPAPADATDAKSVFDKYRHVDTGATQGGEKQDVNQQGADDGSEYGTLDRAKGDPYVGELIGRMTTDFVVPTVVTAQDLVTWGCVKLDESGKITDRVIDPEKKSRSHAFNSAVEERLKLTTDMDKPVPSHLQKMLVGKFVCATYTSRTE